MKKNENYFYKRMPDDHFGIDIFLKKTIVCGASLRMHWHEHLQLYFFLSGSAFLDCGGYQFYSKPGDIIVINSNELHYLKSLSDDLCFYVIRIDIPFLFSSQADVCQTKFIAPLSQNRIMFRNLIRNDTQITDCISEMIEEYESEDIGYELAVKAVIYHLIVLLLRNHVRTVLSPTSLAARICSLKKFSAVLTYMEIHYEEKLSAESLSKMINVSVCYFCRTFRRITGRTSTEYLNGIRLEKSTEYLRNGDLSVTEIALRCGFDSVNYYSRLFRMRYGFSPSEYRKVG